jgi:transcriptional regulator of heat shock response
MITADLKKRHDVVLELIISRYIESAEPVSSRFVARKLNLSSATIRNVMADLEEAGLITHPHTSAGRMPTDKGYRYYINALMHVRAVTENVMRQVEASYHQALRSLGDVMERTSHLISDLTNYVGVTFLPQYDKMYLDGTSHIIEQPEFRDIKKICNLLRCLEEKKGIMDLLSHDLNNDRMMIHIGKELHSSYFDDCSIVTRGYKVRGKLAGRLGVIGPKRMVYEKVIPTVEFLAGALSDILDELDVERL